MPLVARTIVLLLLRMVGMVQEERRDMLRQCSGDYRFG
jgi:hypothetical protein